MISAMRAIQDTAKKSASGNSVMPLAVTGLLALLGNIGGGGVKGYWDKEKAQSSFEYQLIMIRDPTGRYGIYLLVNEGAASIPQFAPPNARFEPGVRTVPSVKSQFVAKMATTEAAWPCAI